MAVAFDVPSQKKFAIRRVCGQRPVRADTRSVLSTQLGTQRDVVETWPAVGNRLRLSTGGQGCVKRTRPQPGRVVIGAFFIWKSLKAIPNGLGGGGFNAVKGGDLTRLGG